MGYDGGFISVIVVNLYLPTRAAGVWSEEDGGFSYGVDTRIYSWDGIKISLSYYI